MIAGCVNSGQDELALWCGFVPLKGELQPHSRSGELVGVDLSAKHVVEQAQPEHLSIPYLDCCSIRLEGP